MSNKFLLLDCNNLAWRSYYATGRQLDGGTTFGFLRELHTLRDAYRDYRFVFFWDHGRSKRLDLLPTYKASRKAKIAKMPEEDRTQYEAFRVEVDALQHEILWDLGYVNIRWQTGYEADDLIAEFVQREGWDNIIIVSSDQDLYQLLEPGVKILKPHGHALYDWLNLHKEHGVQPSQWHLVKALAGCASDDVPGVSGVGTNNAIKFLTGKMKPDSKTYRRIMENEELWLRNQRLVKLPYPGVKSWTLKDDDATKARWRKVTRELKMLSLLEMF